MRPLRRCGKGLAALVALALAGAAAGWPAPLAARDGTPGAGCSATDPLRLYGTAAEFEVRRNGTPIGSHRITFARRDGALIVNAEFHIAITFLGLTVYRYTYESEEVWRDGCLRSVEARIDDDGKRWSIAARGQGGALSVSGPEGRFVIDRAVFPTNHWNADVVRTNAVFNTLTGRLNRVTIERVATETVPSGTGPRRATHYRFSGELETEIWYDADGRWVKMRFKGTDGTPIDYVCQRCGPPPSPDRDG